MSGQFLASDTDRYINIFDPEKKGLVMNLVAEKEVSSLSFYPGHDSQIEESNEAAVPLEKQIVAVVIEDGTIELFTKPFLQPGESQGSKTTTSLKAKAKQMTRKADAFLKIVRPESGKLVSVVKTEFQGPELLVAWAEGGVNVIFERVRWQDQDTEELAFSGTKEVTGRKSATVLGSATVNGVREEGQTQVNESNTVFETGRFAEDVDMNDSRDDAVSISSDEEVSDEEPDSRESKKATGKPQAPRTKVIADKDVEMGDAGASEAEEGGEEGAEPSFGELLRASAPEAIDVEAELEDEAGAGPLVPGKANTAVFQIPSGVSLSTVLSQALKTNDNDMLESCFHTGDLNIIRTTIQRLDSSLAATLLQRLAERLASRPGRYGHLLVWVQWTCIAHGGVIAGKADILKRMSALFKVMDQRSSSLPSLLLLKGKLDMLDAQLNLRQSTANRGADGMDSEDDEDIIYVEGQDDDSDVEARKASAITPRAKSMRDTHGMLTDENDDAIPNGIASGLESDNEDGEGSEDEAEDDEGLIDIEAEESVGSSDAEESLEENEDDDEDEADSDEASVGSMIDFIADSEEDPSEADVDDVKSLPPSKKAKLGGRKRK
jgi:U3 small nucleolar RNA-associated protein 5